MLWKTIADSSTECALQYRAWRESAALFQLGNATWDAVFGNIMPQARIVGSRSQALLPAC